MLEIRNFEVTPVVAVGDRSIGDGRPGPVTRALLDSGTTGVAYETIELPDHSLPLLAPMSEVAGRLAPQVGSHHLEAHNGGRGVLLGPEGEIRLRPKSFDVLHYLVRVLDDHVRPTLEESREPGSASVRVADVAQRDADAVCRHHLLHREYQVGPAKRVS